MNDRMTIQDWQKIEETWWNKFSTIMFQQWELDAASNRILRSALEAGRFEHLYKQNGVLLDLGCGTGSVSIAYASEGMSVVAIDACEDAILQAIERKGRHGEMNVEWICQNLNSWDYTKFQSYFDSVNVNAFLHHIHPELLPSVFKMLAYVTKPGGKIFLYEPLFSRKKTRVSLASPVIYLLQKVFSLFMTKIPSCLFLWRRDYFNARKQGYTGMSPCESALCIERLQDDIRNLGFRLNLVKPQHYRSLAFAILARAMKWPFNRLLLMWLPVVYWIDLFIISRLSLEKIGKPRDFLLFEIRLTKKAD